MSSAYDLLVEAPPVRDDVCFFGCLNKKQLKYFFVIWTFSLVVIASVLIASYVSFKSLPKPLSAQQAGFLQFSEERARKHIHHLVNVIGPRPFGSSANHVDTKNYILSELNRIDLASRINNVSRFTYYVSSHPGYDIKDFRGQMSAWEAMENIIVKVNPVSGADSTALLVSAHYDTVTLSAGATDNTMGVACMLEIVEVLSRQHAARHPVIFAFVNGEENALLGAVDLAEFDPTFNNVGVFINIDGTPGDKSMNFRSSGGWMDYRYAAAPRPLSFVVAGDIFKLGLIKSDTDWSVYTKKITGLDFATFSHRQIYHTLKDTKLKAGAPQFLGDNLLAVIRDVIDHTGPLPTKNDNDRTQHVYYSVFNSGYIIYTLQTSFILNVVILVVLTLALIVIVAHRFVKWRNIAQFAVGNPIMMIIQGFVISVLTLLASLAMGALYSFFAMKLGPYFAFSNTAYAVWVFVFPCLFGIFFIQWIVSLIENRYKTHVETSRAKLLWGNSLLWVLLMSVTAAFSKKLGSTYLVYAFGFTQLLQVLIQHLFYQLGYMSNRRSQYISLNDDLSENTSLVSQHYSSNTEPNLGKSDSKTTHFMWFVLGVIGFIPFILLADLLPALYELAAGTLNAAIFGPLMGITAYLAVIQFLPLSRKGQHYGIFVIIFAILSVSIFFPIVLKGRDTWTEKDPYVVIPRVVSYQTNGRIQMTSLVPYHQTLPVTMSKLFPSITWSCESNTVCTSLGAVTINATFSSNQFNSTERDYGIEIRSPGAFYQSISFPQCASNVLLNGLEFPTEGFTKFMLKSFQNTQNWKIEFDCNTPNPVIKLDSGYTEPHYAPDLHQLIGKLPPTYSFMGTGWSLITSSRSINLTEIF